MNSYNPKQVHIIAMGVQHGHMLDSGVSWPLTKLGAQIKKAASPCLVVLDNFILPHPRLSATSAWSTESITNRNLAKKRGRSVNDENYRPAPAFLIDKAMYIGTNESDAKANAAARKCIAGEDVHVYVAPLNHPYVPTWIVRSAFEGKKVFWLNDETGPVADGVRARLREALTIAGAHIIDSSHIQFGNKEVIISEPTVWQTRAQRRAATGIREVDASTVVASAPVPERANDRAAMRRRLRVITNESR